MMLFALFLFVCIKLVSCSSSWDSFQFDEKNYRTSSDDKRYQAISMVNSFIASTSGTFDNKGPAALYSSRWGPFIQHMFPGAQQETLGLPDQFKDGQEVKSIKYMIQQGKKVEVGDILFSVTIKSGKDGSKTTDIPAKNSGFILKIFQAGDPGLPSQFTKAGEARGLALMAKCDSKKIKPAAEDNLKKLNEVWGAQKAKYAKKKAKASPAADVSSIGSDGSSAKAKSEGKIDASEELKGDSKTTISPNMVRVGLDQDEDYKEPPPATIQGIRFRIFELMQEARNEIEKKVNPMSPITFVTSKTGILDHGQIEEESPSKEETLAEQKKGAKDGSVKKSKGGKGKKKENSAANIASSGNTVSDSEHETKEPPKPKLRLSDDPNLIKPWTMFLENDTLSSRWKAKRKGFSGPLVTDTKTGLQKMHFFFYIDFDSSAYNKKIDARGSGAQINKEEKKENVKSKNEVLPNPDL